MSELLPCPFCGKKAYLLEPDVSNQFWTVSCLSCVAIDITGLTEEQAISKWNTRHYPPEVQQAVERMNMDELIRHFKNLEEDEISKQMAEAFNRGWHYAMENPEVKKALEMMKSKKPERRLDGWVCPRCKMFQTHEGEVDQLAFCWNCGQALDWGEE